MSNSFLRVPEQGILIFGNSHVGDKLELAVSTPEEISGPRRRSSDQFSEMLNKCEWFISRDYSKVWPYQSRCASKGY